MIKFGIITEVKPGYAKVFFEDDDLVTDWWPVLVRTSLKDFESWPLNVKEHVACACGERCEEGVIMGAIHSKPDPPDPGAGAGKFRKVFEDGTVIEYDKANHKLTADIKGDLYARTDGSVEVTAGTNLKALAGVKAEIFAPQVEATAGSSMVIQAPTINITGTVNITGPTTISGPLTAASIATSGGGSISAGSGNIETTGQLKGGQVMEGSTRLGTHKHAGVSTGGGQTGPAIP